MTAVFDADIFAAASHRNMASHLIAPLAAGAVDNPLAIEADATFRIDWSPRQAVVVVAPAQPLGDVTLKVELRFLNPDPSDSTVIGVIFDRFTEAGAYLPLDAFGAALKSDRVPTKDHPYVGKLAVTRSPSDGLSVTISDGDVAKTLDLRLIEGLLGRVLYICGMEKPKIRRLAREIAVGRSIDYAVRNALDRHGADLGVARFADTLGTTETPQGRQIITKTQRETDEQYRARLNLFRRFILPAPRNVGSLLNGPEDSNGRNRGLISRTGVTARFKLVTDDNPFAVAVHVVSAGGDAARVDFFEYIRRIYLTLPQPSGDLIHAARAVSPEARSNIQRMRASLRDHIDFVNPNVALAPMLASALDRLGRCTAALAPGLKWRVTRAQDPNGGSRYELGLGVDVAPMKSDQLATLARAVNTFSHSDDPEVVAIIRSLKPLAPAEDPDGSWMLGPCGMRTVHRVDTNTLYLSHFPTFGLLISGPNRIDPVDPLPVTPPPQTILRAFYHAPGDQGHNAALESGLNSAASEWASVSQAPWGVLNDAEESAAWDRAAAGNAPPAAREAFAAAGLPAVVNAGDTVARVRTLPPELVRAIRLPAAWATSLIAGDPAAAKLLARLVATFSRNNLSSLLPLVTAQNEVILAVAVISLPEAGINLSDRRAAGFRWYSVALQGPDGARNVPPTGSSSGFLPPAPSLYAVVVLGYARCGGVDPYEYRIELPEPIKAQDPRAPILSILQYEFLMNLLERAFAIGVEVNTYDIRQRHVDLDGDLSADPLTPAIFNTYRQYHRPRMRGEVAARLDLLTSPTTTT